MDDSIKNILRIGLFQLKFSDRLPAFAVIDEAVKIAKLICPAGSGLVNAVLRNYLRQNGAPPAGAGGSFPKRDIPRLAESIQPPAGTGGFLQRGNNIVFPSAEKNPAEFIAAFHSHPLWLVKNWIKILGTKDTQLLCKANNEIPPLTLRVNTLKTSRDELQEKLTAVGYNLSLTPFSPDGIILTNAISPIQKTNFFQEGYLRLQDEASQLISYLVNPKSSESILDICAGSGGKTTHLAAIMKNNGRIVAIDYDKDKIKELKKDASRLGITIMETHHADLTIELPEPLKEKFDHVLVDAPCSGLGTLRRNPEIKWRTAATDIIKFAQTQSTILQNASLAVRKGGHLIYCTCSLLPQENEHIIGKFLKLNSHFSLHPPPTALNYQLIDSTGYFRTYPHLHNIDGFFGAILKCNSRV